MTCRPGHRRGPRVIEDGSGIGGTWARVDCGARRSGKACSLFILFLENNNGGKETPTEEKRNSSCSIFIFGLEEKKGRNSGGPAASAGMNGWCLAGRCTIWLPGNRLIGALAVGGAPTESGRSTRPAAHGECVGVRPGRRRRRCPSGRGCPSPTDAGRRYRIHESAFVRGSGTSL